mmetsp:Transcript_349/g.1200  ORF Transcript_349/g.1200 Transcript_349/m.1200 type:complete len:205 (-) Transcript_349:957-1571(-)
MFSQTGGSCAPGNATAVPTTLASSGVGSRTDTRPLPARTATATAPPSGASFGDQLAGRASRTCSGRPPLLFESLSGGWGDADGRESPLSTSTTRTPATGASLSSSSTSPGTPFCAMRVAVPSASHSVAVAPGRRRAPRMSTRGLSFTGSTVTRMSADTPRAAGASRSTTSIRTVSEPTGCSPSPDPNEPLSDAACSECQLGAER